MSSLGDLTAAPITVDLEGQVYRLAPLTLGDLGEFQQWVEMSPYREIAAVMAAIGDDPTSRQFLLERALEESRKLRASMDAEIGKWFATPSGIAHLLWLSLRVHQPHLSATDVGRLVSWGNMDAIKPLLDRVCGMDPTTGRRPVATPANTEATAGPPPGRKRAAG